MGSSPVLRRWRRMRPAILRKAHLFSGELTETGAGMDRVSRYARKLRNFRGGHDVMGPDGIAAPAGFDPDERGRRPY